MNVNIVVTSDTNMTILYEYNLEICQQYSMSNSKNYLSNILQKKPLSGLGNFSLNIITRFSCLPIPIKITHVFFK